MKNIKCINPLWLAFPLCAHFLIGSASGKENILFQLGVVNGSFNEFAGSSDGERGYVRRLGDRDKLFMVGVDDPAMGWNYILPGPLDHWAGVGYWSWRINFSPLSFTLAEAPEKPCALVLDLVDIHPDHPPVIRVEANGQQVDVDLSKRMNDKQVRIKLPQNSLCKGSNIIRMHSRFGSWITFDAVSVVSNDATLKLAKPRTLAVQNIYFSNKEQKNTEGERQSALVVDVINRIDSETPLEIWVDGKKVQTHTFPRGRQAWEVMLPAEIVVTKRSVQVRDAKGVLAEKMLIQKPAGLQRLSDEVNLLAGTCNSRWMFTPGPAMPMSLMRIAPENEPARWKSGYDYQVESIVGFGHIHEWTMCGLLTMPHHGAMFVKAGDRLHPDNGWRSRIDPKEAVAEAGKYSVTLLDTGIKAGKGSACAY